VVAQVRAELDESGCSVLRGFLRPDAVGVMREQAQRIEHLANERETRTNVYNTADDPTLPEDHPARFFMRRSNAFVATDQIPEGDIVRRLYHHDGFRRFVADCVGEPEIHEYADPFARLVLNVLPRGAQHPWHYDTNEFIVSTLVQGSEDGGVFEYCPGIRGPGRENLDDVGAVLRGEGEHLIRRLRLRPGDLQIFRGRFSLHRVTEVRGARPRITGIFAYAKEPGVIGRVERTRQIFGRVSHVHQQAERRHRRADALLD